MKRNTIQNQQFDEERSLYNLQHTDVLDCVFAGPADGESALKEARDVGLRQCGFPVCRSGKNTIGHIAVLQIAAPSSQK